MFLDDPIDLNYTRDVLRSLLRTRYISKDSDCITLEDIFAIEQELKELLRKPEYQNRIENILVEAIDKVITNRFVADSFFSD